jgi:hypothetical protein
MDRKAIINGTIAGILLTITQSASAIVMEPTDTLVGGDITLLEYNDGSNGHYSITNNSQNDIFGFAVSSGFQNEHPFINNTTPSVYADGWSAQQITRNLWSSSALGDLGSFSSFFGEASGEDFVSYYFFDETKASYNIDLSNQQQTNDWQNGLNDLQMELNNLRDEFNAPPPPPLNLFDEVLNPNQATLLNDYLYYVNNEFITNPPPFPLPSISPIAAPGATLGPLPLMAFGLGIEEIVIAYSQQQEPLFSYINTNFDELVTNAGFMELISVLNFQAEENILFGEEQNRLFAEIGAKQLEIAQHEQNQPESVILFAEDYAIAAGARVGNDISSPFSLNDFIPASAFIAFNQPSSGGQPGSVQPGSVIAQSFSPTAVPEPTTVAIFGLALAGLALTRRKKVS